MYDVIVIGGGIVGLSATYHLVQAGAHTLLIDRADPGRATDAGAGILSPETNTRDPDPWVQFAIRAVDYYPELIQQLATAGAGETGYARCGMLLVAVSENEAATFAAAKRQIFGRQQQRGTPPPADLYEVSPEEARSMFPPLPRVKGALFYRHAARVDGQLLAQALQHASLQHGLEIQRSSADQLIITAGHVSGVVADGRTWPAPRVIIAGGAWSHTFGQQLGIQIPVEPQRGQIVHLHLREQETADWPIIFGFRGHYIVPWPAGRVAAGATRETGVGYDPRVTAAGMHEVLSEALYLAPGLADATLVEMRVGLRPLSADGLPILGPVPTVAGVFLATGHGPTGLQLGPFSGKIIAEWALGNEPALDITPFLVTRF